MTRRKHLSAAPAKPMPAEYQRIADLDAVLGHLSDEDRLMVLLANRVQQSTTDPFSLFYIGAGAAQLGDVIGYTARSALDIVVDRFRGYWDDETNARAKALVCSLYPDDEHDA
jgi:hypothetical protein